MSYPSAWLLLHGNSGEDEEIVRFYYSRSGDLDSPHGQTATEYVSHMLKWDDHMFDKDIKELKKILSGPSYNRVVMVEHS